MDLFSPRHLLVILLIVLVVFGTKKLRTIGADLGGAFRGFKNAMNEGKEAVEAAETVTPSAAAPTATAAAAAPRQVPAPATAAVEGAKAPQQAAG